MISTSTHLQEISRARSIAKSLGFYTAARYLEIRKWSFDAALWILCGKEERN